LAISCDLGSIFLHSIFVENTELHIGPRPKIVFIVAGKQHGKILKKKKNLNRLFQNFGTVGLVKAQKITGN
jgi:hypothetical protein